jgi:hypothetical protein
MYRNIDDLPVYCEYKVDYTWRLELAGSEKDVKDENIIHNF